ncbi:hypothetical protein ACLUTX_16085 [Enterobacterales bacterium AE_CKDN230030158-1A_HGKHYDSX7]
MRIGGQEQKRAADLQDVAYGADVQVDVGEGSEEFDKRNQAVFGGVVQLVGGGVGAEVERGVAGVAAVL